MIERAAIAALLGRETQAWARRHPRCAELARQGARHFLYGVPMHWMNDWGPPGPLFVRRASGATLECADGHDHVDFCLADSAAMFGHGPPELSAALAARAPDGLGAMLPGTDAPLVGQLLADRFGLPLWQFALSASDAIRFSLRWARAVTGRSLLGQVDDAPCHARVVDFNDAAALERALADGRVACVVAEPVMTNVGMVLPEPGFLQRLRELCTASATLLLLDETHTFSSGPGGYTRQHGLQADLLVLGKAIAGGIPCAVYGFGHDLGARMRQAKDGAPPGHSGIGTTLAGNLLALAALRATLERLATPQAYAAMHGAAQRLEAGLRAQIGRHALPWCVTRVGARCEFQFCPAPPRNGREARAAMDSELESAIHLYLLNRGFLVTPFHNMMLCAPATSADDVDAFLAAFGDCVAELRGAQAA